MQAQRYQLVLMLCTEWARLEPRQGHIDEEAVRRYV